MNHEHDWEKRLLQSPLPEKGLPQHVRAGIQRRLHEKPKSPLLRSFVPMTGGVLAAALVAILVIHHAGSLSGVATRQHLTGQTTPINRIAPSPSKTKTLNLGASGPIEHYIWEHQGQTNEVWQDVQQGEWRSVKTFPDGRSITSIYKNGSMYEMHYNAQGNLQLADQVVQPAGFDSKLPVFDTMKQTGQGMKPIGSDTYNGIPVTVYQVSEPQTNPPSQAAYSKLFVDTVYQLPLKEDQIVNGSVANTQTWSYSYLPADDRLFTLPTNITFKKTTLTDPNSKM